MSGAGRGRGKAGEKTPPSIRPVVRTPSPVAGSSRQGIPERRKRSPSPSDEGRSRKVVAASPRKVEFVDPTDGHQDTFWEVTQERFTGRFEDFTVRHYTNHRTYYEELYKLHKCGYSNLTMDEGLDWNSDILLGKGGFGRVILCRRRWNPKILVAVKIMDMLKRFDGAVRSTDEKNAFRGIVSNEIKAHNQLTNTQNDNIVKQLDHFMINDSMFVILEYCNNESLAHNLKYVWPEAFRPSEPQCRYWFKQIVNGLNALHSRNLVHLDFKPDNILVHRDPKTNRSILKLCDFSFTCQEKPFDRAAGTPMYMSPAALKVFLFRHNDVCPITYMAKPQDIWALGLTLYEMRYRTFAFIVTYADKQQLIASANSMIVKSKNPSEYLLNITQEFFDLLRNMIKPNEKVRYTIEQIQQNPWFLMEGEADPTDEHRSTKFPQE